MLLSAFSLLIAAKAAIAVSIQPRDTSSCKCLPQDDCWPSAEEWSKFNSTVGGRLVATVPLGSPCHGDTYDEALCTELQDEWLYSSVHAPFHSVNSSSSVMAPLFANASCDPFTSRSTPCTLGNYVVYSVAVSSSDDIRKTIRFADSHNIRLVIRNTGHDYTGRSTGAGALAIWTHHLKGTEVLDWDDAFYKGKALKVGAGVQGYEALDAAHDAGLVVVTGECPSVGLAGGYTQGGGHSALCTEFGLSADNTLSFEVVTPSGAFVTASRRENTDLYWALSGGGPGTYGVVVSMTVQAHPDAKVGGSKFLISAPSDNPEKIYDVIDAFHAALPDIVDSGVMIIYFFGTGFFQVPAMTAYGKSAAQVKEILQPFSDAVTALGLPFEPTVTEFSSYHEHYDNYWGPSPAGNIQVGTQLFGGRLIPRALLSEFGPTARKMVEMNVTFIGVGMDVSKFGKNGSNAVLPQWRDSIVQSSLTLPYSFDVPFEEMVAEQNRITQEIQPVIEAATPGAGAYMNEADFQQENFQETFYGSNYAKLLKIKNKYDPCSLFYVQTGVGSEVWDVANDGRMCRASTPAAH
ncbi:FAD/FMN-containing dehydrogenase [Geosmithia morbida]|uniref:FAD/FMN-containing dehydrogenase n=1 Tax=Geosmithia morbida TaxID=1094350 RepID=A0A9P4YTG2_9HYPO|nr:FAD/FMN-containing dehydrogenase [Geosmithia morbida]KAF4122232.1 FAD/FMN-containing dehydrogenase [Geosmithia morbida]